MALVADARRLDLAWVDGMGGLGGGRILLGRHWLADDVGGAVSYLPGLLVTGMSCR